MEIGAVNFIVNSLAVLGLVGIISMLTFLILFLVVSMYDE